MNARTYFFWRVASWRRCTRVVVKQNLLPLASSPYSPVLIHTERGAPQGASKRKEKENKELKNNPKKQPTDFPSFSFF
jgi:hypothetical protein